MTTEAKKQHHPLRGGSRISAYTFDPLELVMITDEHDPLYDRRVHKSIVNRREFLLTIADLGVETPILVRNRDGQSIVTKGKQRTKGTIIVNALTAGVKYTGDLKCVHEAIEELGKDEEFVKMLTRFSKGKALKIPAKPNNAGDDARVRLAMRVENAHRINDARAETIEWVKEEHEKYGTSAEDIARSENVSVATVKRWLKTGDPTAPKKKRGKAARPSTKKIEEVLAKIATLATARELALLDWARGKTKDVVSLFTEGS